MFQVGFVLLVLPIVILVTHYQSWIKEDGKIFLFQSLLLQL